MQGAEYAGGYGAPAPQYGYGAGGAPYRGSAGGEYGREPDMPGYGYAERQQGGEAYGGPQASRAAVRAAALRASWPSFSGALACQACAPVAVPVPPCLLAPPAPRTLHAHRGTDGSPTGVSRWFTAVNRSVTAPLPQGGYYEERREMGPPYGAPQVGAL